MATASLVSWAKAVEHQKGQEAEATLRMIFEAEQEYAAHEGQNPQQPNRPYTSNWNDLVPKYLSTNPTDDDWEYTINPPPPNDRFTATAKRLGNGRCAQVNEKRTIDERGVLTPPTWPPNSCR